MQTGRAGPQPGARLTAKQEKKGEKVKLPKAKTPNPRYVAESPNQTGKVAGAKFAGAKVAGAKVAGAKVAGANQRGGQSHGVQRAEFAGTIAANGANGSVSKIKGRELQA